MVHDDDYSSPSSSAVASFMDDFGWNLAVRLLSRSHTNDAVRRGVADAASSSSAVRDRGVHFRSNWRTALRHAPDPSPPTSVSYLPNRRCLRGPRTVFVDVTFDISFRLHGRGGGPIRRCRLGSTSESGSDAETTDPSPSVSVRFGALIADRGSGDSEGGGGAESRRERHRYVKAETPTTAEDVFAHCRSVDVDPELTDASVVAGLFADALLSNPLPSRENDLDGADENSVIGSASAVEAQAPPSFDWDAIAVQPENDDDGMPVRGEDSVRWKLVLRHEALGGEAGTIPIRGGDAGGEPIGRLALEAMILQGREGGGAPPFSTCVQGNALLMTEGEEGASLKPSTAMTLSDENATAAARSDAHGVSASCRLEVEDDDDPVHMSQNATTDPADATPSSQLPRASKENVGGPSMRPVARGAVHFNGDRTSSSGEGSRPRRRGGGAHAQPSMPVFARVMKTSIAGSRRKKARFTIGEL